MKTAKSAFIQAAFLGIWLIVGNLSQLSAQPFAPTNALPAAAGRDTAAYVPGEVLVKFRNDVTDDQIATAFRGAGLGLVRQIQTAMMRERGDIGITKASTAMPVEQAVAFLKRLPGIEYAEPNWIYTHQESYTSDDYYYIAGSLWGMYGDQSPSHQNQYGSQAAEAWAQGYIGLSSVVVGIIDEGIQITHLDLDANIWKNPGEFGIGDNGVDDDGNGYVDDFNGWDFYENNNSVYDTTSDDHGTHVAGTIGAKGGNGVGVVGVNWAVSMISGKFLGPNGGDTADAIEAVDYFTALRKRGVPIVALNNSWGGGGYSQGLHDAIIRAADAGILFVAAAGNGNPRTLRPINTDSTPVYPACYNTTVGTSTQPAAGYDSVIAVTAIDNGGNKASWANYGATTVDLGAPGVNIYSTVPNGYGLNSGTSMATPHVTGAIALYAARHYPGLVDAAAAAQIKAALLANTEPTGSLAGKTVTGGRLNVEKFASVTPSGPDYTTTPNPPSSLKLDVKLGSTGNSITLTWTDNSNNEERFEIVRTVDGSTGSLLFETGPNVTMYTDNDVQAEHKYIYSVKACNGAGCSTEVTASVDTAAAEVSAVSSDTTTKGDWINVYGKDGYDIVKDRSALAFGTVTPIGNLTTVWVDPTTDARGLYSPDKSYRFARCYYSATGPTGTSPSFTLDVNLIDGNYHNVSLYFVDWDSTARRQNIEFFDGNTGSSIVTDALSSSFNGGIYKTWKIKGHVRIKITCTAGANAVVSGIFFDPPTDTTVDAPPTVSITSPANNTTVSGTVTVSALASDDKGLTKVEFYLDGGLVVADENGTDGWSFVWDTTKVLNKDYILTARATDTKGQQTTSSGVRVTVNNIVPSGTVHVGDLDGAAARVGANWNAMVTATIHDASHNAVAGASVTATWSGGYNMSVTGTTAANGQVSFTTATIAKNKTTVTFTVKSVTAQGSYVSSENHDPDDPSSDGTTITVSKP